MGVVFFDMAVMNGANHLDGMVLMMKSDIMTIRINRKHAAKLNINDGDKIQLGYDTDTGYVVVKKSLYGFKVRDHKQPSYYETSPRKAPFDLTEALNFKNNQRRNYSCFGCEDSMLFFEQLN
jgi:hypothetical protein